jgi:hypothetical protein
MKLLIHKYRPCDEYFNPQIHASIKVEKSFCLNAYQAIIVYSNGKDGDCKQEIIRGPNVYVLKPKEWFELFFSFFVSVNKLINFSGK